MQGHAQRAHPASSYNFFFKLCHAPLRNTHGYHRRSSILEFNPLSVAAKAAETLIIRVSHAKIGGGEFDSTEKPARRYFTRPNTLAVRLHLGQGGVKQ